VIASALSRFGFRHDRPSKGVRFVKPLSRDELCLAAKVTGSTISLVTSGSPCMFPLHFHADTKVRGVSWRATLFRKVKDASRLVVLQSASKLLLDARAMRDQEGELTCRRCSGPVAANNTLESGLHWRCHDRWCGEVLTRRAVDRRPPPPPPSYVTLAGQAPGGSRLKVVAAWGDSAERSLVLRGEGCRYVRRALRAFGLTWDRQAECWTGPARTPGERWDLHDACLLAGLVPTYSAHVRGAK